MLVTVTTAIGSVCRKCGTIKKSGKKSCCGRGGAWFKNCGRAGNTKLEHTWYEGIQACKARFKAAMGLQLQAANQNSHDDSAFINTSVSTSITTPMDQLSSTASMLIMSASHTPASVSVSTKGCQQLLDIAAHVSMLLITVF